MLEGAGRGELVGVGLRGRREAVGPGQRGRVVLGAVGVVEGEDVAAGAAGGRRACVAGGQLLRRGGGGVGLGDLACVQEGGKDKGREVESAMMPGQHQQGFSK